jgi:hypothetical protein
MQHQDIETLPQISQLKLDLIAIKARISDPRCWCQGRHWRSIKIGDEVVRQTCAIGATYDVISGKGKAWTGRWYAVLDALARDVPQINGDSKTPNVRWFNDHNTHAAVMAWFDRVIAAA